MAAETWVFTVKILPPPKPRSSLANADIDTDESPRLLRLDFNTTDTFAQVWKQIQREYDDAYPEREREGASFTRLQDAGGADIPLRKTVYQLFHGMKFPERTIHVQQAAIDKESSLAPGTHLQPEGYKRKRVEDLTPDRQEAFKRRRLEESRYGSALSDLDADVPVTSRESAQGGAEVDAEEEEHRVDGDGFMIPKKIKALARRRSAQPLASSQEVVLVVDSQPKESSTPQSAASALRQRQNRLCERPVQSVRSEYSSPAEGAAVRPNVPTAQHSSISSNGRQATIPTPDSYQHRNSSEEAPTSGQRPRSSEGPASGISRRFVLHQAAPARDLELDMAVEDPIEDDPYNGFVDIDDDEEVVPVPRGRTRSRSPEAVRQLESISHGAIRPSSQISFHDTDANVTSTRTIEDKPESINAFDRLYSSQDLPTSSNKGVWLRWEDERLVSGVKNGLLISDIQKNHLTTRSDSAVRNRKRWLLANKPEMFRSNGSGNQAEDGASDADIRVASHSSQRRGPHTHHSSDLSKAMAAGYDVHEIVKFFPNRSEDSVRKQVRKLKPRMLILEQDKADFPKTQIKDATWTDDNNLKLRRLVLEGKVTENEAYKLWFSNVTKTLYLRKLAEYRNQMSNLEKAHGAAANESNHEEDVEGFADLFSEQPNTQETGEADSEVAHQLDEQGSSPLIPQTQINSSPPSLSERDSRTSPVVAVTQQDLRAGDREQDLASQESDNRENEQRANTSRPSRMVNGNGGQTTLGQYFQRDKGKKPDRPARPSTSELDAQFGRGSSRATANPRDQARSLAERSDQQEIFSVSSNEESTPDLDDIESNVGKDWEELSRQTEPSLDWEEVSRQAESQLLAESQGLYSQENGPDSQSTVVPETQSDSDTQPELATQPEIESIVEPDANTPPDSFTISDTQLQTTTLPEAENHIEVSSQLQGSNERMRNPASNEENEAQDSDELNSVSAFAAIALQAEEPSRRARPGRLPPRDGHASRMQQRIEQERQAMRSQMDSTTQSPSQNTPQRRNISTASPTQPGIVTELPQGLVSAESGTQSLSKLQLRSLPQGEDLNDIGIPFENRPVRTDGTIDAGRPGFPFYIKRDHVWVQSRDAIWVEAVGLAKPEWVSEMSEYIRDEAIQWLRVKANDSEGLAIVNARLHRARVERRKKMGLSPLHTLRRPRYIVPGMESFQEPEEECDSQYVPDLDEDDNLDYRRMRKESETPDEIDYDREVVEVLSDADRIEEAKILDMNYHENESEHEEDADLPTAPPLELVDDILGPTDAELQDLVQSGDVDVYDDSRSFVGTRPLAFRSSSPEVQPSRASNAGSTSQSRQVTNFDGANERESGEDPTPLPGRRNGQPVRGHRSAGDISSPDLPGQDNLPPEGHAARKTRLHQVFHVSTLQVPSIAGQKLQKPAQKPKKRQTTNDAAVDDFLDLTEVEEPAGEGQQTVPSKEANHMDDDEEDYGTPKKRRAKKTKSVETLDSVAPAHDAAKHAPAEEVQSDRAAMPPPAIIPSESRSPQTERHDSSSSFVTETSSSSRFGVRNDVQSMNRRSRRRKKRKSSTSMTTSPEPQKEFDPAKVHGFTAINNRQTQPSATTPAPNGGDVPNPETEMNTPGITVHQHNGRSILGNRPVRPMSNIPPPPRFREPSPPHKVEMPYGSDDDDSSSSDSSE